jgi:pimeloyl-ACP methyl ester carboxylesterase
MSNDQFALVNRVRLHYLDHPGGEPPLLFLPGWTANAHAFDGVVGSGLSPEFRVVAVDLRGRGLSEKPLSGYSLTDHTTDVIALMDHLKLKEAVIIGHSYGGFLALYVAARYPDRVPKLIVVEAARSIHPRNRDLLVKAIENQDKPLPPWETYVANLKQAPHFVGWWDPLIEDYYRAGVFATADGGLQSQTPSRVLADSLTGVDSEDWDAILSGIRQPTLLLHALGPFGPPGSPPIVTIEMARETAGLIADCRHTTIPGNHLTMLYGANARCLAEEISRFMRGSLI